MTSSVALANARCFTAQPTKVIKLCSTHPTPLHQINMVNNGCVQRKDALNSDAKAGLADGDRFARAAVFASDDYAFNACKRSFVSDSLMRTCTRTVSPD